MNAPIPKYSHIGTFVGGGPDRRRGLDEAETGGSLTEQIMKSEDIQRRLKAKYNAIQVSKQSGRSKRRKFKR